MNSRARRWMTTWTLKGCPQVLSLAELFTIPKEAFTPYTKIPMFKSRDPLGRPGYLIHHLGVVRRKDEHWRWIMTGPDSLVLQALGNPRGTAKTLSEILVAIRQDAYQRRWLVTP